MGKVEEVCTEQDTTHEDKILAGWCGWCGWYVRLEFRRRVMKLVRCGHVEEVEFEGEGWFFEQQVLLSNNHESAHHFLYAKDKPTKSHPIDGRSNDQVEDHVKTRLELIIREFGTHRAKFSHFTTTSHMPNSAEAGYAVSVGTVHLVGSKFCQIP
jgi:hypothetical protein